MGVENICGERSVSLLVGGKNESNFSGGSVMYVDDTLPLLSLYFTISGGLCLKSRFRSNQVPSWVFAVIINSELFV